MHTLTPKENRVRNFSKNSEKNTIFNEHPVPKLYKHLWKIFTYVLCNSQYEFDVEFDIPVTYPATSPEIALPELDGKTAKVKGKGYPGERILPEDSPLKRPPHSATGITHTQVRDIKDC